MNLIESIKIALAAIGAHKLRSLLTLLGIIIGVATVILVVMAVEGFNSYFNDKVADLGSNAFVVTRFSFATTIQEFIESAKRNKNITFEDLEAILNNPRRRYVRDAAGGMQTLGPVKYGSQAMEDIAIQGVTANMGEIDNAKVAEGRYISREDEFHSRTTCFIGHAIAKEFFSGVDPIGKEIKIGGLPFRVVGVAEEIGTVLGQQQDNFVVIPISTFRKLYDFGNRIYIRVSAISADDINNAVDEVRVVLRNRRHLKYSDKDNFGILTPDAINGFRDGVLGTVQLAIIGVASIALIVGGIVIMNIMLVSVTERTREIGIRKSVGARKGDILMQFLSESVTMALFGGAIGVGLAYAGGTLIGWAFEIPMALPFGWTVTAALVSATVGLFSGVYPAYRAAGLDPVESLRAE
jgi:putative ABC transport system permease protein